MAVTVKKNIGFGQQSIYYLIGDLHYFFNGAESDGMNDKEASFNKKEGFSVSIISYPSKSARKNAVLSAYFRKYSTFNGIEKAREEIGFDSDIAKALGLPDDSDTYYEAFKFVKLTPLEYLELSKKINPNIFNYYVIHEGVCHFYKEDYADWPDSHDKSSLYTFAYNQLKKGKPFRIFMDIYNPELLEEAEDDFDSVDDMIAEGFIEFPLLEKLKP
jgi:hypothetical protein